MKSSPAKGGKMTEEVKKETVEGSIEETEIDDYEKAFDDAMSDKPQAPVEPTETKELPKEEPLSGAKDYVKESTPVSKTQREIELEEELAKERHKNATWDGRISAANERAKKAEEELAKVQKAKESGKTKSTDNLPEEDAKVVEDFISEFPDLHKPIVALVKKELLPIIGQLIDDRVGSIEPQVTSIKARMEENTAEAHFRKITNAHEDWKTILSSGELDKWISSKPTYIQKALNNIKAEGKAEEVIDMFSQYKEETGKIKQNLPPNDGKHPSKADELLAVPSSPTTPNTKAAQKSKDDFEAGWEDAIREDDNKR